MKNILFISVMLSLSANAAGQIQAPIKEWTFQKKAGGKKIAYKQWGIYFFTWRKSAEKTATVKGRLMDIGADSVYLSVEGTSLHLAQNDIMAMSPRPEGLGAGLLGAFLLLGGLIVAGLFIFAQLIYNGSRLDQQLAAGEHRAYWPWAILGIGLMVLGIGRLGKSPKHLSEPFKREWLEQKNPNNPNNMP